jgi:hypothetical protein
MTNSMPTISFRCASYQIVQFSVRARLANLPKILLGQTCSIQREAIGKMETDTNILLVYPDSRRLELSWAHDFDSGERR